MQQSVTLWNFFRSSTSFRTRIALELKGIPYEYKAISLLKGEQYSVDYLKINPMGGVPTLQHNDKVIPDSFAILHYLDDAFPQTLQLHPKDPYRKAKCVQLCEVINSSMHPYGNLKVLKYLEAKHQYDQPAKDQWVAHWMHQAMPALEKAVQQCSVEFGKGPYSMGAEITWIDVLLVPNMVVCKRFNVDTSMYPTITGIYENCMKHPAFVKAHPANQVDTPEELRGKI